VYLDCNSHLWPFQILKGNKNPTPKAKGNVNKRTAKYTKATFEVKIASPRTGI